MVSRTGGDTENYQSHRNHKNDIDPSTSPRALMKDAIIADAPAPLDGEHPASVPVIPPEVVQENLRRVRSGAANTLIRVLPDGKREYHESRVVREGDGRIDTLRADRGTGTTASLDMLAKEGKVRADRLLPGQKRNAAGRFTK
jgi:hypothetical protein